MRVEFVNHASLLIDFEGRSLLTDPWFEGRIFGNSWSLCATTPEQVSRAAVLRTSHLFISHEHPDHFHPGTLREAFADRSGSKPTAILRRTVDGRVARWLTDANFPVVELDAGDSYRIGQCSLSVQPFGTYDSYLVMVFRRGFFLNLNDAKPSRMELKKLLELHGPCFGLASQFSIAEWPGSPHDEEEIALTRARYRSYIRETLEVLRPRTFIPFASHISFCHSENRWINEHKLSISETLEFESGETSVQVLIPGEAVNLSNVSSDRQCISTSTESATWWESINADANANYFGEPEKVVSEEELVTAAAQRTQALRNGNNRLALYLLAFLMRGRKPVRVAVTDLDRIAEFSIFGIAFRFLELEPDCEATARIDVSMTSHALFRLLGTQHGPDEFLVAGRFIGTRRGAQRVHSLYSVETLNRSGLSLRLRTLIDRRTRNEIFRAARSYINWSAGG